MALSVVIPLRAQADVVYAANQGSGTIERFDAAGHGTVFATGLDPMLWGLASDGAGNVYAGTSGTIYKITPDGVRSTFASTGTSYPCHGMVFDGGGNLYVATTDIKKITPGGVVSVYSATSGIGLAFDSTGVLYATDHLGTIRKIAPDGTASTFATLGEELEGAAFDSADNLFVATDSSRIHRFTPAGSESLFASTSYPMGVAFDSAGNLYASSLDDTISRFTPGGVGSVFASSGLNGVRFMTIQAPEPSALVLLALVVPMVTGRRRVRGSGPSGPA